MATKIFAYSRTQKRTQILAYPAGEKLFKPKFNKSEVQSQVSRSDNAGRATWLLKGTANSKPYAAEG
jgi:hypothetical protein